ncbi:DUF5615 family PIN-like protein [Nostoc sp.]|uniref:DUF5615 family PIN-like protein n=1 Tax=Nostoc sp. TaxID=1180 RepID=UPI002FF7C0B9
MKFLGDENLDWQIVERLRLNGHEVLYVVEMEPGILDDEVFNLANNESAILLTNDYCQTVRTRHYSPSRPY